MNLINSAVLFTSEREELISLPISFIKILEISSALPSSIDAALCKISALSLIGVSPQRICEVFEFAITLSISSLLIAGTVPIILSSIGENIVIAFSVEIQLPLNKLQ